MCEGITTKGKKCERITKEKYCYQHKPLIEQKELEKTEEKNEIKNLNKALIYKSERLKAIKQELEEKELIIEDLKYRISLMSESTYKYNCIKDFEKMNNEIVKLSNGHLMASEVLYNDTYKNILEKIYNLKINEIIEAYYEKKRIRNKYAHEF